jgi:hypothetical protein
MGQGRMSNHAIGFGGFSVKKCFGWFVEMFGQFSSLRKGPG